MTIEFACSCGHEFRVHDRHAGKRKRCPVCRQRVTVPVPQTVPGEEVPEPLPDAPIKGENLAATVPSAGVLVPAPGPVLQLLWRHRPLRWLLLLLFGAVGLFLLLPLVRWIREPRASEVLVLRGHSRMVGDMALSPDGQHILSGGGIVKEKRFPLNIRFWRLGDRKATEDCTVRLWDTNTGKQLWKLDMKAPVTRVVFAPDGRFALAAAEDVHRIDLETGKIVRDYAGMPSETLAISRDGQRALGAGETGAILWELETGKEIHRFPGVRQAAFAGSHAIVGLGDDGHLRRWNADTAELQADTAGPAHSRLMAFSADGQRALFVSGPAISAGALPDFRHTFRVWDTADGVEIHSFTAHHEEAAHFVHLSPDGRRALSGDHRSLYLWDLEEGELVCQFHRGGEKGVFSPDGKQALSTAADHNVRLWNLPE